MKFIKEAHSNEIDKIFEGVSKTHRGINGGRRPPPEDKRGKNNPTLWVLNP